MSFIDNLQYKLESASIYFQGGVRRGIIIILGIVLASLFPVYFLGRFSSGLYQQVWFDNNNSINPKTITINDYSISETQIVELADGSKDLYVSVSNKENKTVGFSPWIYTLQVLNPSGQILSQQRVRSYLLPDETKFIVSRSTDPDASQLRITQETGTIPALYNEFSVRNPREPKIEIRQQQITELENGNLRISAQFKNNDIYTIGTVDILYIIRDTRQSVVGIGTFQFNGFSPQQNRDVVLEYPRPESREPKNLDLRWSVNYLDENNVRF